MNNVTTSQDNRNVSTNLLAEISLIEIITFILLTKCLF